jgi:hypothetical protein
MNPAKQPPARRGRVNWGFTAANRMLAPMRRLSALLLALPCTLVLAQDAPPAPEAPLPAPSAPQPAWTRDEEPRRSELPESVLRAERQTGGEVLRAERMQRDGREVYRLKVLTPDGRVRIMRDDPRERRRAAWRDRATLQDATPAPPREIEPPTPPAARDDEF